MLGLQINNKLLSLQLEKTEKQWKLSFVPILI